MDFSVYRNGKRWTVSIRSYENGKRCSWNVVDFAKKNEAELALAIIKSAIIIEMLEQGQKLSELLYKADICASYVEDQRRYAD